MPQWLSYDLNVTAPHFKSGWTIPLDTCKMIALTAKGILQLSSYYLQSICGKASRHFIQFSVSRRRAIFESNYAEIQI